MAYNPLIPQATDRLRVSQGDLLGNFANTSSGLGTMLNPNQGYIQFPNQGATPTLIATQPGIYASKIANPPYPVPIVSAISELFLNKNSFKNFVTTNEIPFTASNLSVELPTNASTLNWSYLPSGYSIQFGFFQNKASNATVSFKYTFPNDRVSLFISDFNNGADNSTNFMQWNNFSTAGFNIVFGGGGTKSGYYIVLGY